MQNTLSTKQTCSSCRSVFGVHFDNCGTRTRSYPTLAQIKKSRQPCFLSPCRSCLIRPHYHRNAMADNQHAARVMPRIEAPAVFTTNPRWQRCARERPSRKAKPVDRAGNVSPPFTRPPSQGSFSPPPLSVPVFRGKKKVSYRLPNSNNN